MVQPVIPDLRHAIRERIFRLSFGIFGNLFLAHFSVISIFLDFRGCSRLLASQGEEEKGEQGEKGNRVNR